MGIWHTSMTWLRNDKIKMLSNNTVFLWTSQQTQFVVSQQWHYIVISNKDPCFLWMSWCIKYSTLFKWVTTQVGPITIFNPLHILNGNVVDMLPTCCNVGQMLKIFEIDTNVHDTEKFFHFESRVCGMLWSPIESDRGLADKKYIFGENIFLMPKRYHK